MILSCKSCEKKFVVPDQAITASGRVVQCGSCGNKWKQFPVKTEIKEITSDKDINTKKKTVLPKIPKTTKSPKAKNKKIKKTREINLYSPEYLAKKHGISLKDGEEKNISKSNGKVSFGFYNSILLLLVIFIAFAKGLHFLQDVIIQKIPLTEFYLNYFFESLRNIFEIWKNLISR